MTKKPQYKPETDEQGKEHGTEPEPHEWQKAFVQEHYGEPDGEQEPGPQDPKADGQITNDDAE
jgi:hypothetical protein